MAVQIAENSPYRSPCHFIIRDSSSAPIRISEAAVASLVQRYCRKARTASNASIPDRTSGQNPRNAWSRCRGKGVRSEGLFVNGGSPQSQRSKPGNCTDAGMTGTYKLPLWLADRMRMGERFSGRQTVNFFANWSYSRMPY